MKRKIIIALLTTLIFVFVPLTRPVGPVEAASADSPYADATADWNVLKDRLEEVILMGKGQNVDFAAGDTFEIPADILERLMGENATLAMQVGKGIAFSISGPDVRRTDVPIRVSVSCEGVIPESVVRRLPDRSVVKQFGMAEKEAYPCYMNVHLTLGSGNAGRTAVLYSYDEARGTLRQEGSFQVTETGQAMFRLGRGDEYLVAVYDSYKVGHGDNLTHIASAQGVSLSSLKAANFQVGDYDLIRPGQILYIPEP